MFETLLCIGYLAYAFAKDKKNRVKAEYWTEEQIKENNSRNIDRLLNDVLPDCPIVRETRKSVPKAYWYDCFAIKCDYKNGMPIERICEKVRRGDYRCPSIDWMYKDQFSVNDKY